MSVMTEGAYLTTFPSRFDWTAAREVLALGDLPHRVIEPAPSLRRVAVPAVVLGREARSELLSAAEGKVRLSGWVEYRPAAGQMPAGEPPDHADDCFGEASIAELTPCIADEERIRLVARLSGDIEAALPYLNAVMPTASYCPGVPSLTYMDGHRLIALHPRRISFAKADEIVDAWLILEGIRRRVNETWSRREQIAPCFETRRRPPALEIYKRLPGTNCGRCGETTCIAFAIRLWSGSTRLSACEPAFEPEHARRRPALVEICAGLGLSAEADAGPRWDEPAGRHETDPPLEQHREQEVTDGDQDSGHRVRQVQEAL